MDRGLKFAIAVFALLGLLFAAHWGLEQPYTARVVDAETGEPIEGAVYLAAWYRRSWFETAFFEGPTTKMVHFREGFSDENGEIFVPGFWFKVPYIGRERNLTVYKPGYAMWNQDYVFPSFKKRKGFWFFDREVRQESWKDEYSYADHNRFLISAFRGTYKEEKYLAGKMLFDEHFSEHDGVLFRQERFRKLGVKEE